MTNIGKVCCTARFIRCALLLSLCLSSLLSLPVSATGTTYNLGNYELFNQANGTPTTAYRLGSGSYGSFNETGANYSESFFNYNTQTELVIRMQMRGSNNTMPELRNPSLIEYTLVTNNLTWRGSANVSTDFLPLGCELSGTVGAWSSWSCIGLNTDSASGGSNHIIVAGNWWSIAASSGSQANPYLGQIQVVDWRQYVSDNVDYTQLLNDIRSNTADTATLSQQIRNQLVSLNTTTTNIYSILQTLNDRVQSINQSTTNQNAQEQEDRQNVEDAEQDAQDSADQAQEDLGNASESLTQTFGNFLATFNTPAGDCSIPLNDLGGGGILDLGFVNFCSLPDQMHSMIRSILNLVGVFISLALAVHAYHTLTDIIAMYVGVGFGYEQHYRNADSWSTAGLINQWSSGHDFEA